MTAIRAGAGRVEIACPRLPLEGFTSVHDALHARAVAIDAGRTVVIVALEMTSIFEPTIVALKRAIGESTGIPPEDVVICATHTFSAPHIFPDAETDFAAAVESAVVAAVGEAVADLRPATLAVGRAPTRVGGNRDIPTPHGWWLGLDPDGATDPTVTVLRVTATTGDPIALVVSQGTPPAVLKDSRTSDGGRAISSDFTGAAARSVEERLGGVVLTLLGAGGDQTPLTVAARPMLDADGVPYVEDVHEAGFELVDRLGVALAADILTAVDAAGDLPDATWRVRRSTALLPGKVPTPFDELRPVREVAFVASGDIPAPVVVAALGDLAIVGVQPELAATTGLAIVNGSPFPATLLVTMADGAAKYLVDAEGYARGSYGALNSPHAPGAAEELAAHIGAELWDARAQRG